jgi:hypothetical protein
MTRDARRAIQTGAAMVALLTTATACRSGAAEYLVLERFFSASHLRDRTALARFATTIFEPKIDGSVDRFTVVEVSPDAPMQTVSTGGEPVPAAEHVAQLSLDDPVDPVDLGDRRPVLVERTVTIDADIRRPDGTKLTRRMQVSLVRASVSQPRVRNGRWIVTAFR